MRLRIFLTHFIILVAAVLLMAFSGYMGLHNALYSQAESQLKSISAGLATVIKESLTNQASMEDGGLERIINDFRIGPTGYAWLADEKLNITHHPDFKSENKNFDQGNVTTRIKGNKPVFFMVHNNKEKRFVFAEYFPSIKYYLIITESAARSNEILEEYLRFIIYWGSGLIILSLAATILLSRNLMRPLTKLTEFTNKLAVGEHIEKAEALKDPDVAPIATVLERFYSQTHKEKTMDQNPLSGLPGNKSLYDVLYQRIDSGKEFAVGYIDGNNFTAYNNMYGYEKGDSVIRFMGTVSMNAIKELGNEEDRVFHLGADRYFFVTTPAKVKDICEKIIRDYDTQIVFYYDEEARSRGYIVSKDKNGKSGEFSFMPICIGVATNIKRPMLHPLQIGHIAGEIRTFLRGRQKSDYLIDRRNTDREEEHRGDMAPFTKDELEEVKKEIEKMKEREAAITAEGQPVRELTAEEISEEDSSPRDTGGTEETGKDKDNS